MRLFLAALVVLFLFVCFANVLKRLTVAKGVVPFTLKRVCLVGQFHCETQPKEGRKKKICRPRLVAIINVVTTRTFKWVLCLVRGLRARTRVVGPAYCPVGTYKCDTLSFFFFFFFFFPICSFF